MTRQEIIKRYENIKLKWDNDADLKRILPETYLEICRKLEGVKAGAAYTITDNTNELKCMIAYVGGQIPSINKNSKGEFTSVKKKFTYEDAKKLVNN